MTPQPPLAPADWLGWQQHIGGRTPLALWNLTIDLPDHPRYSTVTTATLREAGYTVHEPALPAPAPSLPGSYRRGSGNLPAVRALGLSDAEEG